MNSIKQRKGGITPELAPSSSNKHDEYTKKQQQQQQRSSSSSSSSNSVFRWISLVLTITGLVYFFVSSSSLRSNALLLRRSSNHNLQQQQQQRQTMSTNSAAIETAAEKNEKEILPRLANIRNNGVPHSINFNYTTLTGTYTLYNVNINQHDGQQQKQILGIIHYPIADLSTLLIEEASSVDYIGRLIMTLQFQQQQQQTSLLQPFSSLLSDTSFHSVISTTADVNNHNNKDEDDASANIWSSITRKGYKPGNLPNQDRSIIAHLALFDTDDNTLGNASAQ